MPRKDPAARAAYNRAHYEKLKAEGSPQLDAQRERARRWYAENRERLLAEKRAAYAAKRAAGELPTIRVDDAQRARHYAWVAANPERYRAIKQRRRARLRGAEASLTSSEWLERLAEYCGRCAYCVTAPATTMEHMTPLSRGGRHELTNVVPACGDCNNRKGTRTLLEFVRLIA